jgi:DNA-binding response OmpR family regulator
MQKSVKVLVVEDSVVTNATLTAILRREGYEPLIAHDGNEALAFIDAGEMPSAVLLDILLPYIDGFTLLAAMRRKEGWRKVPIIMVSAKTQEQDVIRALDMGASDYIMKPFRPGELAARLRRHLKAVS